MSPIDPPYLSRSDPTGANTFGNQPMTKMLHAIDLVLVWVETRKLGGADPERFHVKQISPGVQPGLNVNWPTESLLFGGIITGD